MVILIMKYEISHQGAVRKEITKELVDDRYVDNTPEI
jgi:hypothetical protein